MSSELEQLTKDASGWLSNLLATPGMVQTDSSQAANVLAARQWLSDINAGNLIVTEKLPPEGDAQPGGNGAAELDTVDDTGAQE